MTLSHRVLSALRAAGVHFSASLGVAALAATLVFGLWYPFPYRELAGGRELFWLVVSVDVLCGPLLTLVIFNPAKPRPELWRDLGLVILIQVGALGYGLWSVWQARPLFLVQEIRRFKVIAAPDLQGASLAELPQELQPRWTSGPVVVAVREPRDEKERETVTFDTLAGGRDYAERPDFYLPYAGAAALKAMAYAKPLAVFLQRVPSQQAAAQALASAKGADLAQWFFLPMIARQDWVVVIDRSGDIQGFLKGDGF